MEKLKSVSLSASLLVDGNILETYQRVEDMELPSYKKLRETLRTFAENMNVLYVYYLRPSGKWLQYIVDNDFDETTRVGLDTPPIDPEVDEGGALDALAGNIGYMQAGEYRQYWKELVSAYAPVYNSKGEIVAVVGVDIKDSQILSSRSDLELLTRIQILSLLFVFISGFICLFKFRRLARLSEAANKSKSYFLARMSHELRTPLNAIIGLSEVELREGLPGHTRSNLEKILSSGSNLLSIVNDILDISKIEAGGFEIIANDFDLPTLINDVVQLNIVGMDSKDLAFSLDIKESLPLRLRGDDLRLKQILNNLLSNAFKYTNAGRVTLRVRSRCKGAEAIVLFSVTDTGVGIKREEMDKLFEQYSQMKSRPDRNIAGTGLGLSITKHLVELMGGTIRVKSKYGRGSVFSVTLRLKVVDNTPIGWETADNLRNFRFMENRVRVRRNLIRAYMPQGRVLVVDDVMVNLNVARGLMMPYGLTIDCALSAGEAIERIRAIPDHAPASGKYDLIFMDHMMPGMDGMEAVWVIRTEIATEYARTVPIVALTANAISGSSEMFLENGFNGFLSKPIDLFQLDAVLNQWITKKEDPESSRMAEQKSAARAEHSPGILLDAWVQGVDFAAGMARYDSEEMYLGLIRSYVRHTPELLERLSVWKIEQAGREEIKAYLTAVHALKGTSYVICAEAVGRLAEALEEAARAEDWPAVRSGHPALSEAVKALIAGLAELLQQAPERGEHRAKALRAAPDQALLEKMLSAARDFHISLMEELLAELECFEYQSGSEIIAWLRRQTDSLDCAAVAQGLQEIFAQQEAARKSP
ncbi:MAG: response regulator [Deltaproteobacteria bacterium]|nr:response regulator [Deltaproteobacteria bacterium]